MGPPRLTPGGVGLAMHTYEFRRLSAVIVTWPYTISVSLLLLNDQWLKAASPGVVTGKLSDFAGLAVVAILVLASLPRRTVPVYVVLSAAFAWWKSSASESFIDLLNTLLPVHVVRTVDYSDLLALAVLPFCRMVADRPERFSIRPAVAARVLRLPRVAGAVLEKV